MSGTLIAAILGPFAPVLGVLAAWLNLRSTQARNHEALKAHVTKTVGAAAGLPVTAVTSGSGGGGAEAELPDLTVRTTARTVAVVLGRALP